MLCWWTQWGKERVAQTESSINMYEQCVHAKSLKSCLSLCNPVDYSPSDSSVHGNLQARILGGFSCPPPGDLPDPGIKPTSLAILALPGGFLTTVPPGKPNAFLQCLPCRGVLKAHRIPSPSAAACGIRTDGAFRCSSARVCY